MCFMNQEPQQQPIRTSLVNEVAILLEHGIVFVESRRNYPATIDVYLDAMTKYHALREKMTG